MRPAPELDELRALGRAIVDDSLYMVIGTSDEAGRPWVSPVYFAPDSYRDFIWVSRPDARHSRNLAARPELSIAVFDSSVPIGTGRGVYIAGSGRELARDDRGTALEVFSRRSLGHGGRAWTPADVEPPAALRLYCGTSAEQYVLDASDRRVAVRLWDS